MFRLPPEWLLLFLAMVLPFSGCSPSDKSQQKPLLLFAAAGTMSAVEKIVALYESQTGEKVRVSFAASSTLARQIDSGARPDIYISANEKWMAFLTERGLVEKNAPTNLVTTDLVLVSGADSALTVSFDNSFDFARCFEGRLSMGDPAHVPAGIYGKAALESLGWWEAVKDRLAPAPDVKSALRAVSMGQAQVGIVYRAVAQAEKKVSILGAFPNNLYPPITFLVAPLKESDHPIAQKFLAFLHAPEAEAIWEDEGFRKEPGHE